MQKLILLGGGRGDAPNFTVPPTHPQPLPQPQLQQASSQWQWSPHEEGPRLSKIWFSSGTTAYCLCQWYSNWHTNKQQQQNKFSFCPQPDLEVYYKFSPLLMQYLPKETVDAWIRQGRQLDPKRLIPALVQYDQRSHEQVGPVFESICLGFVLQVWLLWVSVCVCVCVCGPGYVWCVFSRLYREASPCVISIKSFW